ncbi:MAG: hypothetical protein FWG22_02555 [Prolixibacteraceae bacterium]|nr:hypothetical protein [Prolixibacteraceae bacterium]
MSLLTKYREKVLQKQMKRVKRNMRLPNFNAMIKVGIIWTENDKEAYNFLSKYFKPTKAIIRSVCYTTDKEESNGSAITPKDLNFFGFPQGGVFDTFINADLDLLLNVSVTPCFAFDVMTALSKASFRIGWDFEQKGYFDMSIDVSKNPNSKYLAEQQIHYLEQLIK